MAFWAIVLAMVAASGYLLWRTVRRMPDLGTLGGAEHADMAVYRAQLEEVEGNLARGIIGASEAEPLKVEIARRILEHDRTQRHARAEVAKPGGIALPMLLTVLCFAGAFALYDKLGAPGYPDQPMSMRLERAAGFYAERLTQIEAEAEAAASGAIPQPPEPDPAYATLMEQLRSTTAQNPDSIEGFRLLVQHETRLGNLMAAADALRHIIALQGPAQTTAFDHAQLADLYVQSAAGYVSPEAEAELAQALALSPKNGTARFYMGLMWAQTGRPDRAFSYWRPLLEEGPEDAPWIAPIRAQMPLLADAAGVTYTPPPTASAPLALPGPDAADVAAASEMSAQDRTAMIRSMVDGLSARLASEGGSAQEWARLIAALGVLGEKDRAMAIWTEAQEVFAGHAPELAALKAAANQAGLAQ
ncbi:MAG: c-type cytochrome biogenesis protein CcmI [Albidovulum sp.]